MSDSTKPERSTQLPVAPAPERDPVQARPSLVRQYSGFVILVLVVVVSIIVMMMVFRHQVDQRQHNKSRYAAERAIALLEAGEGDVGPDVDALLKDVPIYKGGLFNRQIEDVWEGPVLRNRVHTLTYLAGKLLDVDRLEQAELVAWKSLLEYHIASRVQELLGPWELMGSIKFANQDWVSAFQVSKILTAQGARVMREPSKLEPLPIEVDPERYKNGFSELPMTLLTGLGQYFTADTPEDFKMVASTLQQVRLATQNSVILRAVDNLIHHCLTQTGDRSAARAYFAGVWGRDPAVMDTYWNEYPRKVPAMLAEREPSLLEMMWRDRPPTTTLTVSGFLDSFYGDKRLRVLKFDTLAVESIGYFSPSNNVIPEGTERMILGQGVACRLEPFRIEQPVHQLVLAYESTGALGIFPILLVKVDDRPYIPVYCDSTEPALTTIETYLAPGQHVIHFVYLNDAAFNWPTRDIKEDRNLMLYRLALVQVPPIEPVSDLSPPLPGAGAAPAASDAPATSTAPSAQPVWTYDALETPVAGTNPEKTPAASSAANP